MNFKCWVGIFFHSQSLVFFIIIKLQFIKWYHSEITLIVNLEEQQIYIFYKSACKEDYDWAGVGTKLSKSPPRFFLLSSWIGQLPTCCWWNPPPYCVILLATYIENKGIVNEVTRPTSQISIIRQKEATLLWGFKCLQHSNKP